MNFSLSKFIGQCCTWIFGKFTSFVSILSSAQGVFTIRQKTGYRLLGRKKSIGKTGLL